MTVNSYLEDLSNKLVLSEFENNHISTSIDYLETKLTEYLKDDLESTLVFGSYRRNTILPRSADDSSDVDLMVIFNNSENLRPQTYLNRLRHFAENYYSSSEIYQSSPTFVLDLNHIKFELVPAYKINDDYYISDGNGSWIRTVPNSFNSDFSKANENNGYKIKPVVRLIKYWNAKKNLKRLKSFKLEELITTKYCFQISAHSLTTYLRDSLEALRYNFCYDTGSYECLVRFSDQLKFALEIEEQTESSEARAKALGVIKEVLPAF